MMKHSMYEAAKQKTRIHRGYIHEFFFKSLKMVQKNHFYRKWFTDLQSVILIYRGECRNLIQR